MMGPGPRPGPGPGHQEEITHVKSVLLGGEETKTSAESVSQGSIKNLEKHPAPIQLLLRLPLIGTSGGPFACRICNLGNEVSTYNCRSCTNREPKFEEHTMDKYCN